MSRPRGFTLLEVLVALTLLSMIMIATIGALRTLGNTKTTIEQVTNRIDKIRVVSEFLRNTIGQAMPVLRDGVIEGDVDDISDGAAAIGTYFWGGPTQMVWVSPLLAGASLGGTFVMQMTYIDKKLELKWHPYDSYVEAFNWDEIEPRVLLEDVTEFELGYLAVYGGEWVDEWAGAEANPVAVRLNIMSGGRYWPEMIVRLDSGEFSTQ